MGPPRGLHSVVAAGKRRRERPWHLTRVAGGGDRENLLALFDDAAAGACWLEGWQAAGPKDVAAMRSANPVFIPRNHRVEEAIQGALSGDRPTPTSGWSAPSAAPERRVAKGGCRPLPATRPGDRF